MTTDTQSLTAGRALDVRIATDVMAHLAPFVRRPIPCPDGRPGCAVYHSDLFDASGVRIPRYSTDIAAAWPLLAKVSGDWHVSIAGGGSIVTVQFDDYYDVAVNVSADTAPLAICRAAIAAVESH